MREFSYARAADAAGAIQLSRRSAGTRYLAGGTNLVDLMRELVERPAALVDVTGLSRAIEAREDGSILIGAAATNTDVASHTAVRERFPALARAILAGASGQIRNVATTGGNILQRTRCTYFYDEAARCNKREPGTGCDAIDGLNRIHAVLGASPSCVATHPSDMCVALAAFGAVLHLQGPEGARRVDFTDFHLLPEGHPEKETVLQPDELITAVELPALAFARRSTYRKVRDRASYAFALVSVAASIDTAPDDTVRDVRIALGGVAAKPWRAFAAEAALRGKPATEAYFREAAEAELAPAAPLHFNGFKIELAKRVIAATLADLLQGVPA
jgi:xanthine dehydrogenase YagS FAD-binding subunit